MPPNSCELIKPRKSEMSFWFSKDPKKTYRGNTDHWAKQKIAAYIGEAKKAKTHTDSGVLPPRDVTLDPRTMFVWADDRKWRIPHKSFDDLCLEILDGQLPGYLSVGKCKNLQSSWCHGICYEHAKEDFEYWPYDVNSPFQLPPKDFRLITSITAHPPHNLKRVKLMMPKAKKHTKSNVPI